MFTPGPQPKVASCAHSTVSPCRSWNPSQDSQAPRWSVCRGGVLLSESPASPARVQTQLRGWLLKGSGDQTPGTGLQAGAAGPGRGCSRSCWSRSPLYRTAQRREPGGREGLSLHPWPVRQPCDVSGTVWGGSSAGTVTAATGVQGGPGPGWGTCLRGCSGQPLPCQALSFLLPPRGHQTDPSEGPEHVLETVDAVPTNWAAASPPLHKKEALGGPAGPAPGSGWQGRTRECAERTLRNLLPPGDKVPLHQRPVGSKQGARKTRPDGRGGAGPSQTALPPHIPGAVRGLTPIRGTPRARGPVRAQLEREQDGPSLLVQVSLGSGLGSNVAWGRGLACPPPCR